MGQHKALKILLALLPALILTQNWAWMTGNKLLGVAFLVLWAMMIFLVFDIDSKNEIMFKFFRATEIGFFLLPLSAIVLTFIIGSMLTGATSGAAQAGAAIGTAIGGTFMIGLSVVIAAFGGIILHLIANRYEKKLEKHSQPAKASKNFFLVHRVMTAILAVIALMIIVNATAAGHDVTAVRDNTNQTANTSGAAKEAVDTNVLPVPTEPSPVEIQKSTVTTDIIGTPQANVTVKNISAKDIDGIKIAIKTFNNFDEPVNGFLTDNTFQGIAQETVSAGGIKTFTWTMYNFDKTTKIKPTVYEVHYTDGTSWGGDTN